MLSLNIDIPVGGRKTMHNIHVRILYVVYTQGQQKKEHKQASSLLVFILLEKQWGCNMATIRPIRNLRYF